MLTFFTTGKAFRGHDGIIQRNALASWKRLHPDAEVILFGDEDGAADVCRELELIHVPDVERHECGKPRLDSMFRKAQEIARHPYLCYSNCDIILVDDFRVAFEIATNWKQRFLMVSKRVDIDVTWPIDFGRDDWAESLRETAITSGFRQDETWVDFFLFPKDSFRNMPALIVSHCYWDHWMIWRALADGMRVMNASKFVVPIHQNHGYDPQYGRTKGMATDALSLENLRLIGGEKHLRRIDAATHQLTRGGAIRKVWLRNTFVIRSFWQKRVWFPVWHTVLNVTRPARHRLGMRKGMAER